MEYIQQKLPNNVSLHMLPMEQYKTTYIGIFYYCLLDDDVAASSLLPHVLQRGTVTYPTARELRSRLAELYGTQFGIGILKRGENLVLQLRLQLVNDRYIPKRCSLLEDCLDILQEVTQYPYLEHGHFAARYVEGEKKNIQARIRSLLNDKGRFAFYRCLQHLCPQRGYSRNKYGTVQDVKKVEPAQLWERYQWVLSQAPVDIFVCGRYNHNRVVNAISSRFNWERSGKDEPMPARGLDAAEHRQVRESMDIQQGKLVMALTTDVTQSSDCYPALILYNGILGAYPHSKLFQQVREQRGLAYYIGSSLDSIMGLQFISGGIDADKFEETIAVIREQLEQIRLGQISREELEWTRASLRTGLLQMHDDLGEQVALAVDGRISSRRWTISELIRNLERLSVEDVTAVARRMRLQTTYFLSGEGS